MCIIAGNGRIVAWKRLPTVDGRNPANHLWYIKPFKYWDIYYNWLAGFLNHQQYFKELSIDWTYHPACSWRWDSLLKMSKSSSWLARSNLYIAQVYQKSQGDTFGANQNGEKDQPWLCCLIEFVSLAAQNETAASAIFCEDSLYVENLNLQKSCQLFGTCSRVC